MDVPRLWASLLAACSAAPGDDAPAAGKAGGMEVDSAAPVPPAAPQVLTTLSLAERRRTRLTFVPPPAARDDPLAIVELARSAEVVLLALPGDVNTTTIDDAGRCGRLFVCC